MRNDVVGSMDALNGPRFVRDLISLPSAEGSGEVIIPLDADLQNDPADVPRLLAEAALATGRVRALGEPEDGLRGYWLVAPLPQWRQKKVRALVAVLQQAQI